MVNSITSKSDSIQVVYDNYLNNRYIVNRMYQRKLVWRQEEKKAFIDSILNNYSVPLFLLAQNSLPNGGTEYEIIDGMQRLNAIIAFIENEYPIEYNGKQCYFSLDTLASTLNKLHEKTLVQKSPVLPKEICLTFVSYQIPFSYIVADKSSVEEIFRRINSFGKQLSGQEIRQAGATGIFSDVVRRIATTIRGDVSNGDKLPLNKMKEISLSNVKLPYGIDVNDIWWIKQRIITPTNIRVSRDEELIAWLVAYIVLGKDTSPSSKALNRLYRFDVFDQAGQTQAMKIENKITQLGSDNVLNMFCGTFSLLLDILHKAKKDFCGLVYPSETEAESLVRTFQIVFLSLYELRYRDHKEIANYSKVIECLGECRKTALARIREEEWNANTRHSRILSLKGQLEPYFKQFKGENVARDNWSLQIDNIMRLSTTEGSQYDFKMGFHDLSTGDRNEILQKKCIKFLTAASNKGVNTHSYLIVGITEGQQSFEDFKKFYGTTKGSRFENTNFYITGIDEEVKKFYGGSIDKFQNEILSVIKKSPIEDDIKHYISTNIKFPRYYDTTIMMLELVSEKPVTYDDKYFERQGNNIIEVTGIKGIKALESRFK